LKPKIFIDGEHGTTGLQIRARLAKRHDLEVISIPEAERRNKTMREDFLKSADIAILCLPDDAAKEAVALLDGHNSVRVIDTSTAHRVHPDWAYGFAEMDGAQRGKIAAARFVANPGCYPTGVIGLVRPLVSAGLLPPDYPLSVNAVSGYTGGGKQMIAQMEDAANPDHISSAHFLYGLPLQHKHVAEMKTHGLITHRPIFSPSVGRFAQGMLVQVPLHLGLLSKGASIGSVHAALTAHYGGQNIVKVVTLEECRALARLDPEELNGRDNMRLYVFGAEGTGQVNLVAQLDNLGKGASGAAVQNMDLMLEMAA
jgi:N-acetyl-gamma-glutamyl-phosphate reductase